MAHNERERSYSGKRELVWICSRLSQKETESREPTEGAERGIKKGLSRKDLATQAEISEASITKCENGDTIKIAPVKIKNIARILDLNPLEILGFKDLGKQPEKIIVSAADFSKEDFAQIKQFIEFMKNKNK